MSVQTIADFGKFIGDMLCALYLMYSERKRRWCCAWRGDGRSSSTVASEASTELEDSIDEMWRVPDQPVKVPVGVVLVIIISYTALGGWLPPPWRDSDRQARSCRSGRTGRSGRRRTLASSPCRR